MTPFVPTKSGTHAQLVGYDSEQVNRNETMRVNLPPQFMPVMTLDKFEAPFKLSKFDMLAGVLINQRGSTTTTRFKLKYNVEIASQPHDYISML